MRIFRFPPEAAQETAAFSVMSEDLAGEVMLVPPGAQRAAEFEGPVYNLDRAVPQAREAVFFSSRITDGTLKDHLQEALTTHGKKLWLLVEPYCHLYPLPCPHGTGQVISRTRSAIFRSEQEATYTEAFCCNYCTLLRGQGLVHLYDTQQTIAQKLELAAGLGVENVLILDMEKAL